MLFKRLIVTQLVKKYPSCLLMEPEGSLSCSQKPATGPYLEPLPHACHVSPHLILFDLITLKIFGEEYML
jgi:hypothetical protein